jgi:putative addiction module killer protein
LQDAKGKAQILSPLEPIAQGSVGDTESVGDGLRELRVHVGPGYRIDFAQTGRIALLLLCVGDNVDAESGYREGEAAHERPQRGMRNA